MNLLIIGLKILLVVSWVLMVKNVLRLYHEDIGVKLRFDWLSMLNISGTVGLTLVSLFAAIDSSVYVFTACLIAITIAMVWFLNVRLMIAGDHKALLGLKLIELKDIRSVSAKFMTLYVETKTETIRLYAPVTERSVTMQLYDASKGRRKKA